MTPAFFPQVPKSDIQNYPADRAVLAQDSRNYCSGEKIPTPTTYPHDCTIFHKDELTEPLGVPVCQHCSIIFLFQLSTADGRGGTPHRTYHFNYELPMADEGGRVGWVLHIVHVTSTLNCQ